MLNFIYEYFLTDSNSPETAMLLARVSYIVAIIIIATISDLIAKKIILRIIGYIITKTSTSWDDKLHKRKVFSKISHLAPAVVLYLFTPMALTGFGTLIIIAQKLIVVYILLVVINTIFAFLNASQDIYDTFDASKEVPIKGFIQITKLIVFILALVIALAIILNKSPIYLISGLGAMTAVLLLIFKDAILGLVAGIQLIANRMIAKGDWIEMPKYGADGDVVDIALTTVKVQNFDNTITTIPTYTLISESFKNWRGMQESAGRRIKRSINININSIAFCTDEMLNRFSKIQYISDYIETKKSEVSTYNSDKKIDTSLLVNGRNMTNLGTFRAYIVKYLENHPMINKDLTLLVRQLAPTEHGVPLEIYTFSSDKNWVNFEKIQSDIFDHLFAVLTEFDLEPYQSPSGSDFSSALNK